MNHVTRRAPGPGYTTPVIKEAIMRDIIESLSPQDGHIDWKWVGSVFAFYVVVMIGGVGVVVTH
ncbi:hypothetical protein JQ553_00025 [Bradyrhizobium lablabi]|nr:hypothetical protein [Bradyrhizobium lablabi]